MRDYSYFNNSPFNPFVDYALGGPLPTNRMLAQRSLYPLGGNLFYPGGRLEIEPFKPVKFDDTPADKKPQMPEFTPQNAEYMNFILNGPQVLAGYYDANGEPTFLKNVPEVTVVGNAPQTYFSPWDQQYYAIGHDGKKRPVDRPSVHFLGTDPQAITRAKITKAAQDDSNHWHQTGDQITALLGSLMAGGASTTLPLASVGNTVGNALKSTLPGLLKAEIGGRTMDLATRLFTPYSSWGEGMGSLVQTTTGYNPNESFLGRMAMDFTNPGYWNPFGVTDRIFGALGDRLSTPAPRTFSDQQKSFSRSLDEALRKTRVTEPSSPEVISQYANSQKNAVRQMEERMADPEYAAMIRANSNPEFAVEGRPIYIEGRDWRNSNETLPFLKDLIKRNITPSLRVPYYIGASDAIYRDVPFALDYTPYAYVPKKNVLLSRDHITPATDNLGRQHQYSILKSHEGSHIYAHPLEASPLHPHLRGWDRVYFADKNGAELSARGTQLKNYFDKKSLSSDELKYAAEHYVEDTGIDNNMTSLFELIKDAEKSDPEIWKKMAKWFSAVSPVAVIGMFNYNNDH